MLKAYVSIRRSHHCDGIDRAFDAAEATGDAGPRVLKIGKNTPVGGIRGKRYVEAIDGTGIDTRIAGYTEFPVYMGLRPTRPKADTPASVLPFIQNCVLGANTTAGATIDTAVFLDFVPLASFPLDRIGRTNLDTHAATDAVIIYAVGHRRSPVLAVLNPPPL